MLFKRLGISEPILKTIKEQKFEKPSKIQEKCIPLTIEGKDVIAGSATGSGKTLAFGCTILQNTQKGQGIQALILTPTRELAEQVSDALKMFSKHEPLSILAVYGGVSINPQINKLRNTDIVVGTPGRILDHLERGTLDLNKVKVLVLDEADRMLDMGFLEDVSRIISQCPKKRQTLLFSATISPDIQRLSKRYMKNPIKVSAETYVDPKKLKQVYYDVQDNLKFSLLVDLLKKEKSDLVMVFCNTRRNTDFIAKNLKFNGIKSLGIHGGFSQEKRNKTMKNFHSQDINVLVCTDVAARGLDIKGVSHVYNYDSPNDSKEYVHRIGRTARAGEKGKVINLISSRDHENFSRVLRDNDVKVEKQETPEVKKLKLLLPQREKRGSFRGQRRNYNRQGNRRYSKNRRRY